MEAGEGSGRVAGPMSKSELAARAGFRPGYFWARLVHANAELMERLRRTGYNKMQKMLTIRQVRILADEFGLMD